MTLYGNVDIRQVNLSFRVSGLVKKMNFDEGNIVKTGQIVAELDSRPYTDEVNIAKADLENSKANLLKFQNGNRKQEIASAKARMQQEEANYKKALLLYKRQKEVICKGAVSLQALDDSESFMKEALARLKTTQEEFDLAQEGFRQEDILQAKALFEMAKARLDRARTNLNDTKIIAPNEGTILTRIQEPGSVVNVASPVYTLSLKSPVWIRTYIEEPNLGKISPGMKTEVYTDSRPNKPYEGHIGFISPVAEFTPKNVETTSLRTDLVYRLRVIVDNPDKGLRQGMPITVKVKLLN